MVHSNMNIPEKMVHSKMNTPEKMVHSKMNTPETLVALTTRNGMVTKQKQNQKYTAT